MKKCKNSADSTTKFKVNVVFVKFVSSNNVYIKSKNYELVRLKYKNMLICFNIFK